MHAFLAMVGQSVSGCGALAALAALVCLGLGMAITQVENKISARLLLQHVLFAPGDTSAHTITPPNSSNWFDAQNYSYFLASLTKAVGTGAVSLFAIVANDKADGSGTTVTVCTSAANPAAVSNQAFLECSAQQLARLSADNSVKLRYLAVKATFATGTDKAVVTFLGSGPRFADAGLTADAIF